MKLRALSNINSGQFNAGDVFEMADEQAEQLIEAGAAEAFDGQTVAEAAVEPTQEAPATPAPLEEASVSPSVEPTQVIPEEVVQPQVTPEQIAADVAALEPSSNEVRIS